MPALKFWVLQPKRSMRAVLKHDPVIKFIRFSRPKFFQRFTYKVVDQKTVWLPALDHGALIFSKKKSVPC